MGYYMSVYSIDDQTVDELVLYPAEAARVLQEGIGAEGDAVPDPTLKCDLDKAWHALHWLLARVYGCPLTFLCGGGRVLTDTRYCIRLHDADEVGAIQAAMALVPDDDLRAAYNPSEMGKVYPDIIWRRDGPEALRYVLGNAMAMRAVLNAASVAERSIAVVGGFKGAPDSDRLCTRILGTQRMSDEE